jgi:hypothetical protein
MVKKPTTDEGAAHEKKTMPHTIHAISIHATFIEVIYIR